MAGYLISDQADNFREASMIYQKEVQTEERMRRLKQQMEEERIYEIHIWHLRFGEVLHLRFDELLQVIDVDGFKGRIGFFFGKGVNVNEKVSQSLIIRNRDFLLLAHYPPIVFFCQPHCSLPTEAA